MMYYTLPSKLTIHVFGWCSLNLTLLCRTVSSKNIIVGIYPATRRQWVGHNPNGLKCTISCVEVLSSKLGIHVLDGVHQILTSLCRTVSSKFSFCKEIRYQVAHLSDTVQQISMDYSIYQTKALHVGQTYSKHSCVNVSDTVQEIKLSMFWTVSLTFDLIHFVGHCPANISL